MLSFASQVALVNLQRPEESSIILPLSKLFPGPSGHSQPGPVRVFYLLSYYSMKPQSIDALWDTPTGGLS